jgi:hypothetical protein
MVITGYALDFGKVVHFEDTDINCGIPVYIAHDLSYHYAEEGQVLITNTVYKQVIEDEYAKIYDF